MRAVEAHQGLGDPRRVLGHLADLVARDGEVAEHRVGEDLGQILHAAGVGLAGEAADIDVVGLRQTQEDLRGQRPLVALEMVEIARGDAEILGHPRLGQAEVAAHPAQARAEEEFPIGRRGRHATGFVTIARVAQVAFLQSLLSPRQCACDRLGRAFNGKPSAKLRDKEIERP